MKNLIADNILVSMAGTNLPFSVAGHFKEEIFFDNFEKISVLLTEAAKHLLNMFEKGSNEEDDIKLFYPR